MGELFMTLPDGTEVEMTTVAGEPMLVVRVDGEPYPLPHEYCAAIIGF